MDLSQKKISYKLLNKNSGKSEMITSDTVSKFLFQHLDQYGDEIEDIQNAINYVFEEKGGHILIQFVGDQISGVVVINETGMSGYIPENILVYIAVDLNFRGMGLGKKLMENSIKVCKGDIALHVEKDNPAKHLYENLGFTNPYLEMRLKRI
ncbi:MAG: GNAT family N-acetyltransferase [Crocinitomicaceae bacterium]